MRTIRTRLGSGSYITVLLCLPCGACVLQQPNGTTDINLDTGSETTQISGADSSSGDTGSSSSSGAEASGSSSGAPDSDADSSSGAPNLCGNGQVDIEAGEACDGRLNPTNCIDLDPEYNGGTALCGPDCQFDVSGCERCEAPKLAPCDADNDDPFNAIELDCDLNPGWDPGNSVSLSARNLESGDPTAFRVLSRYGNHPSAFTPRAGERALLISTSSLPPVDPDTGVLTLDPGSMSPGVNNGNPDSNTGLPDTVIVNANPGGSPALMQCAPDKDCSNTLQGQWDETSNVYDLFYVEFETVVPQGTHGYELDLAFFTAHYPAYNKGDHNDIFVLWSQSERYVGNVTYLRDGDKLQPMRLPELVTAGWLTLDGTSAPELAGTGFHGQDQPGGGTRWLTVAGPATPGESLTLAIAAFDLNEAIFDSALLVDNFRWTCAGCDLSVDCGLRLQQ